MRHPDINKVQSMIEFLIGREEYAETTLELCMIRRKISLNQELSIHEIITLETMTTIKFYENKEIDDIIFGD